MALQFSLSPSPSFRSSSPSPSTHQPVSCSLNRSSALRPGGISRNGDSGRGVRSFAVRSSLDTAGPVVGQVTEVNKDTFWPLVKAAGSKVVVLDMYTQWYATQPTLCSYSLYKGFAIFWIIVDCILICAIIDC